MNPFLVPSEMTPMERFVIALATMELFLLVMFNSYMKSELSLVITHVAAFCTIVLVLFNRDDMRDFPPGHFQEIGVIQLDVTPSIAFKTAHQLLNSAFRFAKPRIL